LIHVFHSRRDTFARDDVLQENIIIKAGRADGWAAGPGKKFIHISTSDK